MSSDLVQRRPPVSLKNIAQIYLLLWRSVRTCIGLFVFILLGSAWLILPKSLGRRFPAIAFGALLRGFGIKVHRAPATASKGELLLANHVSWTDIPVLGVAIGASFVAKQEVRHWPFIGQLAARYGCLFVDRDRRTNSKAQAVALANLLTHRSLILFPEGTTGDGQNLLPFRSSLVGAIAGAQGRCVPVAIVYRWANGRPLGRNGWRIFAWVGDDNLLLHAARLAIAPPIRAEVILSPPIEGECRKTLTRQAEESVLSILSARRAV